MKFDAKAEKKRSAQEEKIRKKQNSQMRTTQIYPVDGITKEGYIKLNYGSLKIYAEVFDVRKYDLGKLTIEQADQIESMATRFYGEYQGSIKEIFRNFPERNKIQQGYFKRLMARTTDMRRLNWIEDQINILTHLEKTYTKLGSWELIFAKSKVELETKIERLETYASVFGFYPISKADKILLFSLINNPGGSINGEKED